MICKSCAQRADENQGCRLPDGQACPGKCDCAHRAKRDGDDAVQ